MYVCIYIYIYIYTYARRKQCQDAAARNAGSFHWVLITGGCSGRGVQWIGVVLYNKLVFHII